MVFEIVETEYPKNHQVWSNFNGQYNKNPTAMDHIRWFKPSLGWSSGPTALRMACDHGHKEIYILGFDYTGHNVENKGTRKMFNNMFKIIPFVNFPATSRIAIPLMLALVTLVVFVATGVKYQGIGYFKEVAFPPGVPAPVYLLLTPIELVSTFILRPLTLTVRLFANMVAGHILLTIVFLATHAFFRIPGLIPDESNILGLPIGILTLLISPLAVGFEAFVSFLQAYIFAILAAVYLSGAVEAQH